MEQTLQKSVKSRELFFKTHEITVFLCSWESSSSVGETDNTAERRELWGACCLFAAERKYDLLCQWGAQPQPGAWDPSSLVMGGQEENMGSGAGQWWKLMQCLFV